MTYDLAAVHNNAKPHDHTPECEYAEGNPEPEQFLRCLRVELDQLRAGIPRNS